MSDALLQSRMLSFQKIVNHIKQAKAQPAALPSVVNGCYDETKLHVLYEQSLYCPDLQPKGI
jgi:NAD dependent epimerase/dehydratase family enzyme